MILMYKSFLDNKKLDIPVSRYLRSDVISAVKNYGENNTNPGFLQHLSIQKM